jgi:hypothetical protein
VNDPKSWAPINHYFSDATSMSNVIDNAAKNKKITKAIFFRYINKEDIPKAALKGKLEYYYVRKDAKGKIPLKKAGFFYIYNVTKDIYYFFRKV